MVTMTIRQIYEVVVYVRDHPGLSVNETPLLDMVPYSNVGYFAFLGAHNHRAY